MQMRKIYIGVIGASEAGPQVCAKAEEAGRLIAQRGAVLVCGGLGGVMQAAAKGASGEGGVAIGILPGEVRSEGNRYLTYAIPTGMSHARNHVITLTADGLVAVGGEYGTLTEIAFALKAGKPVVSLSSWQLDHPELGEHLIPQYDTPAHALDALFREFDRSSQEK